jgi:hypothetical protein
MMSGQYYPYTLGLQTRYNGRYKGQPSRETEQIPSKPVSVRIAG